jgi:hypothetical protein
MADDYRSGKDWDKVKNVSKADLLKIYGPKIKDLYGQEEFNAVKREDVNGVRMYIADVGFAKGGSVTKKKMNKGGMMAGKAKAAKKMMRGGVAKKKMRGGGMAKMAQKKMMRGGMVKKKMMRGGAVKKK